MDNDSFNPTHWRRTKGPVPAAPSSSAVGSAFWREAKTGTAALSAPVSAPAASPAAPLSERPPGRGLLGAGISLGILVVAGLAAWVSGQEPAPSTAPTSAVASAPAGALEAGQVERSFSLSDLDQLSVALNEAGVGPKEANAAAGAAAKLLGAGSGELDAILVLQSGPGGDTLQQLRASRPDGSGVMLARQADGSFAATLLAANLTRKIRNLRGEIDSESFYTSAVSAGLVDTLIPEFINAFAYDFNLASEVARGAVFEVAYDQQVNGQGEPVGTPKLVYAELTTPQKSLALYRFVSPGGEAGWFDGNGATTKRGLMRTPIDGARISSKFGMRFHPVLHYNRLHAGVDFAAPTGTPIYAAADGTVTSASPSSCAGNMLMIQHDKGIQTRYFHASRYAEGLHVGQRVTQGEIVSYVGSTGTCTTGPHLHYETLIDGQHVDPLSIPVDDANRARLKGAAWQSFVKERDRIDLARERGSD